MKERLLLLVEGPGNFFRGVLRAASRTETLVYNSAYDGLNNLLGPDAFPTVGMSLIIWGLFSGGAVLYTALHSPLLSDESLVSVTRYAGSCTVASVVLGIDLIRYDIKRKRTHLP